MSEVIGRDETSLQMITGATLDPMGAGVIVLWVQPLLRTDEKIRAIVAEDHGQRRLHVITQQRYLCFDRRRQNIASQFEVRTVVRGELSQDGIGHRADIERTNGTFTELRTVSAQDARTLGSALVRACDEALHDVETLVPLEVADPTARLMLSSGQAHWPVSVSRDEVRTRNVSSVLGVLAPLLTSPLLARRSIESVTLSVEGYADRPQELWEIAEVRTFLQHLDAQFPYWFAFLDKRDPGLRAVVRSVLPVGFNDEQLSERLSGWWMPHLDRILDFAEADHELTKILVERSLSYLRHGPSDILSPALPTSAFVPDEPEEDEPEPLDVGEVLGDLAGLLPELPPTWRSGPEDDLLVFLWSVLQDKGLVRRRSQVEHVRSVASLLALHKLRSLFHIQAYGAPGAEEEYRFPSEAFVGTYPRAEPFWIGVHAGADATFDMPLEQEHGNWAAAALDELAQGQYDEVIPALRRALGENALFAALLASRSEGARYPVPESVVDELRGSDLDGALGEAWDWLGEQGR